MSETTTASIVPSEASANPSAELPATNQHWADTYFLLHPTELPFKPGVDLEATIPEAQRHLGGLQDQQNLLLEVLFAKIEQRDPLYYHREQHEDGSLSEPRVEVLLPERIETMFGLPRTVLSSNRSLAGELFKRLGPDNKMARSDIFLTTLAGLVAEEAAQNITGDEERKPLDVTNPAETIEYITNFASSLRLREERSKLSDDQCSSLLLTAELLGEAMRAPDSVRERVPEFATLTESDIDRDYYNSSVVDLCDSVIDSLKARPPLEEKPSKTALRRERERAQKLQAALLTKYDILFDTVEAQSGPLAQEAANRALLKDFAHELGEVITDFELGFAYEAFAPLAFRYAALEGGTANARIWHGTSRNDTPKDLFGSQNKKLPEFLRHVKKQSSDAATGSVGDFQESTAPYGIPDTRLQLKARADAHTFTEVYDDRIVSIHSKDAIALLKLLDGYLSEGNPTFAALPDKEKGESGLDEAGVLALQALVGEIAHRLDDKSPKPVQTITINNREIRLNTAQILDELILPAYTAILSPTAASV